MEDGVELERLKSTAEQYVLLSSMARILCREAPTGIQTTPASSKQYLRPFSG